MTGPGVARLSPTATPAEVTAYAAAELAGSVRRTGRGVG
jgi:hypothetical protein